MNRFLNVYLHVLRPHGHRTHRVSAPLHRLIDGRVGFEGAEASFTELAKGQSTASKILVFPGGAPGTKDACN